MQSTFGRYLLSLPTVERAIMGRETARAARRWRGLVERDEAEQIAMVRHARASAERLDRGEGWASYLAIVVRGAVAEAAGLAQRDRERAARYAIEQRAAPRCAQPVDAQTLDIWRSLARLPTRAIAVLYVLHVEQETLDIAAKALGIPKVSVRRIDAEARARLRRK